METDNYPPFVIFEISSSLSEFVIDFAFIVISHPLHLFEVSTRLKLALDAAIYNSNVRNLMLL